MPQSLTIKMNFILACFCTGYSFVNFKIFPCHWNCCAIGYACGHFNYCVLYLNQIIFLEKLNRETEDKEVVEVSGSCMKMPHNRWL